MDIHSQKVRIKCFKCRKWYSEKEITRDGYSVHHKNFRLGSVIVLWVPLCNLCSTFRGKLKSVLVRAFGRLFVLIYLNRKIKKVINS